MNNLDVIQAFGVEMFQEKNAWILYLIETMSVI